MQKIKKLVTHIKSELDDAEEYARQAAMMADEDSQTANLLSMLASQELEHAHKLHDSAVRTIKAFRETGREVPAAMQAVWDWEHENMVEHEAKIKLMLK